MFKHVPVLLDQTIKGLNIKPDGTYLDATLGGAGHSSEILKRLDTGLLIGFDQDINALEASDKRLSAISSNYKLYNENFAQAGPILAKENIELDGILMDIGVSSHQIDTAQRGFSYMEDGKLDMRMDQRSDFSAYDLVNTYSEEDLADIFWRLGEEKWSKRIAEFIIEARTKGKIETTGDLVKIIKAAVPVGARTGGHPAKRVFQAIRIEVNRELKVLEKAIPELTGLLNKKGRFCIISFHSLEDRIVKEAFKYESLTCICPPELPVCMCDKKRRLKLITRKPIEASDKEKEENSRARSAKLRIAERV